MLPKTAHRVRQSTSKRANRAIQSSTRSNVRHAARNLRNINVRLLELDQEWDVERTLEANAATLALAGIIAGGMMDRRFLLLPGLVAAFLLQHALQGWCPPLPVLRALGFRTMREIDDERSALKALRGDYSGISSTRHNVSAKALSAAQR